MLIGERRGLEGGCWWNWMLLDEASRAEKRRRSTLKLGISLML